MEKCIECWRTSQTEKADEKDEVFSASKFFLQTNVKTQRTVATGLSRIFLMVGSSEEVDLTFVNDLLREAQYDTIRSLEENESILEMREQDPEYLKRCKSYSVRRIPSQFRDRSLALGTP